MSLWKFIKFAFTVVALLQYLLTMTSFQLDEAITTRRGIQFEFMKHFDVEHDLFHSTLNSRFGAITKMTLTEMKENERVFTTKDGEQRHLHEDAVDNIKQWLVDKVKAEISVNAEKTTAEIHLQNVEMVWLNSRGVVYEVSDNYDLNCVNSAYFGNQARNRVPEDIKLTGWFIIYLNINRLWPSLDDVFDDINWSVIHTTKQTRTVPAPPAPAPEVGCNLTRRKTSTFLIA